MNLHHMRTVLAAISFSVAAFAQNPITADSPFQVKYFSNLNLGDSQINISNSGFRAAGLAAGITAGTTGSICANIYAFSPDEQMIACCSCPVTPNGLVSLSAQQDLISNPLTPAIPTSIVVKILASVPSGGPAASTTTCANSAANPLGVGGTFAPPFPTGLLAWGTTLHRNTSTTPATLALTETAFTAATLGTTPGGVVPGGSSPNISEIGRLSSLCTFIQANGSLFGLCRSCRLGGQGAGRI